MTDGVGPVVLASDIGWAVVAAIREQNAGVNIQDRGSYLRVLVSGRCGMTCEAVARALGRPFRLPSDLELVMPSFRGRLLITTEQATWTFEGRS